MSDADRIQRWRQRMRDEGKEPMSLWLSRDTKLRLEELASVWHCAPSELVEQALAHFHPGNPSVPGTIADTEQLQALLGEAARALLPTLKREILQELRLAHDSSLSVLDTNRNVTETQDPEPHASTDPAPGAVAEQGHSLSTEPPPTRKGGRPRSAIGQQILALLATHPEGLSAKQIRGALSPGKHIGDTLSGMKRLGTVQTRGQGKAVRYVLAPAATRQRSH
jgi:predicted transcriptional regulator